jgi:hypothetical protein
MEKLGMTLEGYARDGMLVKGSYRTIGTCSILRNEWTEKTKKDIKEPFSLPFFRKK